MAENKTVDLTQKLEYESGSDDDIDELFKKELNQLVEGNGVLSLDAIGASCGSSMSNNLSSFSGSGTNTSPNVISSNQLVDSNRTMCTAHKSDGSGQSPSLSTFESLWDWSMSTYRWTRQLLVEGFGQQSKTIDPILHSQIVALYATRRQYRRLCKIVEVLATNFEKVLQSQVDLGNAFLQIAAHDENLVHEFQNNAEVQTVLHRNGRKLLVSMGAFISGIETLCNQTIVDTLWSAKQLSYARIQFDALKSELDAHRIKCSEIQKVIEAENNLKHQKQIYDSLKENLQVKLKLLHENRISVMRRQLESFHTAIAAFFAGNETDLEAKLKQFQIQLTSGSLSSWLEEKNAIIEQTDINK